MTMGCVKVRWSGKVLFPFKGKVLKDLSDEQVPRELGRSLWHDYLDFPSLTSNGKKEEFWENRAEGCDKLFQNEAMREKNHHFPRLKQPQLAVEKSNKVLDSRLVLSLDQSQRGSDSKAILILSDLEWILIKSERWSWFFFQSCDWWQSILLICS